MTTAVRIAIVAGAAALAACTSAAHGAITAFSGGTLATPADLDTFMGTALLPVPYDVTPVGTGYGNPPSTLGIALLTPAGPLGFEPEHVRTAGGTPTSSGSFSPLPLPDPIADSHIIPPSGVTALDFYLQPRPGSPVSSIEITATGTSTSATFTLSGLNPFFALYVGFGAVGETITDIHIVNLPDPTPVSATWDVSDLRVLPTPGTGVVALGGLVMARRRRR